MATTQVSRSGTSHGNRPMQIVGEGGNPTPSRKMIADDRNAL